jgi:hypothetical protein
MSKKTLLKEATVRRFMKLANVGSLSDQVINEMGYGHMGARDEDEDEDEVAMGDEGPEMAPDEGPEMAPDEGPEMAPEEGEDDPMPEEEPEMDSEEVEITEDDRAVLASAISVLEKIAGDAGGEEMDMGMEEPMPEDPAADEDDAMMEGSVKEMAHEDGEEKPMEEGEGVLDEVEVVDESELVNEVTRRVAKRLRSVLKKRK